MSSVYGYGPKVRELLLIFADCVGEVFVVVTCFFNLRKLNGVDGNNFKFSAALFALHCLAYIDIVLDIEGTIAFGTYYSHGETSAEPYELSEPYMGSTPYRLRHFNLEATLASASRDTMEPASNLL
jgi:hypothetical protein